MATAYPTIPALYTGRSIAPRNVFKSGTPTYFPSLAQIDGTASRDPGNDTVSILRAGLVLGKITSGGNYAPSIIGLSGEALDSTETVLDIPAAVSTELARRVGATGTFKLIGPPTAAGTVRTMTATYSALGATTVTITALGVNEVQTLTFGAAATGGTLRLRVPLANGTMVTTDAITWNATDATYLASINTALDAATGVAGGIVATGAAPDTALTFTFSGTGYTALPQPTEMISVVTFPTSTTSATVVRTTTGVDGRFVTSSIIAPTDGSETPLQVLSQQYGVDVLDINGSALNQSLQLLRTADINVDQIVNYPSDASLKTWLKTALKASSGFTFSDDR